MRFLSALLVATLITLQLLSPAYAVKYKQIFLPESVHTTTTTQTRSGVVIQQIPVPGQQPTVIIQPAQSSSLTGQVHTSQTVVAPLQSPAQVLAQLKAGSNIPGEIATQIGIQNASSLNAATNGQQILITKGLWDRLQTNDQRAFVIGHELAHVVLQHVNKTQFRRVGLSLLDRLLGRYVPNNQIVDLAANLGLTLYDKRQSRVYEYEADDLGIQLMTNAQYDPQAAIQVFAILKAASGARGPEFLQDHPITDSRIRALVQKYQLSDARR